MATKNGAGETVIDASCPQLTQRVVFRRTGPNTCEQRSIIDMKVYNPSTSSPADTSLLSRLPPEARAQYQQATSQAGPQNAKMVEEMKAALAQQSDPQSRAMLERQIPMFSGQTPMPTMFRDESTATLTRLGACP